MNANRIQDSSVSGLEGCVIITNGRLRYSFSLLVLRLREFLAVKLRAKIPKIESRLNNQYIYYVIKKYRM